MKDIIVSATYKGKSRALAPILEPTIDRHILRNIHRLDEAYFMHGLDYWLLVSSSNQGVKVQKLQGVGRDELTIDQVSPITYDSIVSFLFEWDAVTSYPTFKTIESKRQRTR